MRVLTRVVAAIGRHKDKPLAVVASKIVDNVMAYAGGAMLLRGCTRVGVRARCFGRLRIDNEGSITIGDDFAVSSALGTSQLATRREGRLEIGDGVSINYGTSISASEHVRIGNRAMIGPFCVISDTDMHGPLVREDDAAAAIEIGEDVWLAARVVVRPGARIGAGAVIAAGSVVEGVIPPRAVASGSPARVLRVRGGSALVPPAPNSAVRDREDVRAATG